MNDIRTLAPLSTLPTTRGNFMTGHRSRRFGLLVALGLALLAPGDGLPAQAPTGIVVRGTVVDDRTNEPVSSANISVEGGSERTQSDEQGAFTLTVASDQVVLMVTRIGFAPTRFPLEGNTTVTIRLTKVAVTLNEVVTVGYGTQRRTDVTGSVASISPEKLEDKPNQSFVQALEGSLPGVSVATTGAGAEPDMRIIIRGRRSITASTAPLVVVDGIPYNGSLTEISQNDIASIDILKDASAAAIYGSRGSNGVILVTTKKGSSGKPRVSYQAYVGTSSITNVPRLMNGSEFAAFKCERLNAGVNCDSVLTATERDNLAAGRSADWVDLAMRSGKQQQHNLSVAGGSEDTRYYLGGAILDVGGVARNDDLRRYTARFNLDQKLVGWLSLGTNTQFARTDRSGLEASFSDAFFMNPLTNPYESDGRTLTVYPWQEDVFWGNPLQNTLAVDRNVAQRVFSSNYAQVDFPFLDGLSYRFNGGVDIGESNTARYYGRNTRTGATELGVATTNAGNRDDWTVENILRYTRAIGLHNLDLTTLYSAQGSDTESRGLRAEGFPNDVLTYYQANVGAELFPSDNPSRSRMISQMGRAHYGFADRYLATFTVRRDGYSGFGANNKYAVFPSVALAWNASNESFWPFAGIWNMAKLRVSYGASGNQAITPYRTLSRLDDYSYVEGATTLPGYRPVTLGNPDLKWETTRSFNVGADFAFLKERITGTIDAYRATTRDLLLDRSISPVHGITTITQNIGATRNTGFEVSLSTLNYEGRGISWRSDVNYAQNRNRIVDLYGNGQDDIGSGWFIGMPIDVNYGYKFNGIWQVEDTAAIKTSAQKTAKPGDVKILDVNGDGVINASDRTFIGSLEPKYTAGLTNTLTHAGFTLSAFLHTVQGVTRANGLLGTNLVQSGVRRNTILRTYWTPENRSNTVPANNETSNPLSVAFYEDASFIRLRDVTLGYEIPGRWTGMAGAESLRLYVNGRNLWTSTDWTGLDPELDEQRAIPLERLFTFGVNARF